MKSQQFNNNSGNRLNIDDIIDYLTKNKNVIKNIGCVDLNTKSDSDEEGEIIKLEFQNVKKIGYLPKKLKQLFKLNSDGIHKFLHSGSLQKMNVQTSHKSLDKSTQKTFQELNVSFFSSIITCLDHTFLSQPVKQQQLFLTKLIERLKHVICGSYFNHFGYKDLKWDQNEMKVEIDKCHIDKKIMKFVSDYFCINIFILDIANDKLYFCGGDEYVSYKKHIFLLKYNNDIFEPCFTEQCRTFTHNDVIVKDLLLYDKSNIEVYQLSENKKHDKIMKFTEIEEDLSQFIGKIKKKAQIIVNDNNETKIIDNIDDDTNDIVNAYTENDYDNNLHTKNSQNWHILDINDSIDSINDSSASDTDSNNTTIKSDKNNGNKIKSLSKSKSNNSSNDSDVESTNESTSESSDEIKLSYITPKLKLDELQNIAKKLKVVTHNKSKQKTKTELITDIKKCLTKK